MVTRRILFQTVLKSGLGTLCAQLLPFAEATAAEVHPILSNLFPPSRSTTGLLLHSKLTIRPAAPPSRIAIPDSCSPTF